jgi:hypothetical protein
MIELLKQVLRSLGHRALPLTALSLPARLSEVFVFLHQPYHSRVSTTVSSDYILSYYIKRLNTPLVADDEHDLGYA